MRSVSRNVGEYGISGVIFGDMLFQDSIEQCITFARKTVSEEDFQVKCVLGWSKIGGKNDFF